MIAPSFFIFFVLFPRSATAIRVRSILPTEVDEPSDSIGMQSFDFSFGVPAGKLDMAELVSQTQSAQDGWHTMPVHGGKSYGSMHIPKTAGSSLIIDVMKSGVIPNGDGFYSQESCFSNIQKTMMNNVNVTSLPEMITFLRVPRNHVYSQYLELVDDKGWNWEDKKKFSNQFPSFASFLDYFVDPAGAEKPAASIRLSTNFKGDAYHPKNMQTRAFTCYGSMHDLAQTNAHELAQDDLNMAVRRMEQSKLIGLTEFYQESFCLLHDKVQPDAELPTFCNCKNTTEWSKFHATRLTHSVRPHSVQELSAEDIKKIDVLTRNDVLLYRAGKAQFLKNVKELEQRRGLTILCE